MTKTKNLSLAEAHASGRKYRRALSGQGNIKMSFYYRFGEQQYISLTIADALATDYELEPQVKLLTREQICSAYIGVREVLERGNSSSDSELIVALCDALFGEEDDK